MTTKKKMKPALLLTLENPSFTSPIARRGPKEQDHPLAPVNSSREEHQPRLRRRPGGFSNTTPTSKRDDPPARVASVTPSPRPGGLRVGGWSSRGLFRFGGWTPRLFFRGRWFLLLLWVVVAAGLGWGFMRGMDLLRLVGRDSVEPEQAMRSWWWAPKSRTARPGPLCCDRDPPESNRTSAPRVVMLSRRSFPQPFLREGSSVLSALNFTTTSTRRGEHSLPRPVFPAAVLVLHPKNAARDTGALRLAPLRRFAAGRRIDRAADALRFEQERETYLEKMDQRRLKSYYDGYDELDFPRKCLRPPWTYRIYPNCNTMHEISAYLAQPSWPATLEDRSITSRGAQAMQLEYAGQGYYRDSWHLRPAGLSNQPQQDDAMVLKHLRLNNDDVEFDYWTMASMHVESLILERLSASNRTTDIYGHCATSILVEPAQEITYWIVPDLTGKVQGASKRGRIFQKDLDQLQVHDVHPLNNFTAEEKLDLAIAMAEGIAEMHGYVGGVIVNDDVHPDQWLMTRDGRVVLNDMNNAVFLEWNYQKQHYCKYWISYGGDFHAPEEYKGSYVDESVDIWPMGNMLFSLLTGLWPYYRQVDEEQIQETTMRGPPFLDPRYYQRSFIERRLVQLMNQCYQLDPTQRPDIFAVVRHLHETKRRAASGETLRPRRLD